MTSRQVEDITLMWKETKAEVDLKTNTIAQYVTFSDEVCFD